MDRDKQIEEIAKDINLADLENCSGRCIGCEYRKMITEGYTCVDIAIATSLTAKSYRKASEVAREIFEEIGKILYKYDKIAERDKSEYGELIVDDIACAIGELKKKYTEGEG